MPVPLLLALHAQWQPLLLLLLLQLHLLVWRGQQAADVSLRLLSLRMCIPCLLLCWRLLTWWLLPHRLSILPLLLPFLLLLLP